MEISGMEHGTNHTRWVGCLRSENTYTRTVHVVWGQVIEHIHGSLLVCTQARGQSEWNIGMEILPVCGYRLWKSHTCTCTWKLYCGGQAG